MSYSSRRSSGTVADDAVTTSKILDDTILDADVAAAAAIDATKIADGTVTSTEFQYINTLSSNAQTQLTAKAPLASPTFTTAVTTDYLTASEIVISSAGKGIVSAPVATYPSLAELAYVKGVTSAVQTQLNTKMPIDPRVSTETSSATPTIDTDAVEHHSITALALAVTSMTSGLSGTPVNFQKLTIRFLDDGTGRAIAWGASYAAMGTALPTTTTASKVLTVGFIYDSVDSKWGCVASSEEA
jgi:hypothetical protein